MFRTLDHLLLHNVVTLTVFGKHFATNRLGTIWIDDFGYFPIRFKDRWRGGRQGGGGRQGRRRKFFLGVVETQSLPEVHNRCGWVGSIAAHTADATTTMVVAVVVVVVAVDFLNDRLIWIGSRLHFGSCLCVLLG